MKLIKPSLWGIMIISFCGTYFLAPAQIILSSTDSVKMAMIDAQMPLGIPKQKQSKRVDLDGAPFMAAHLLLRDYHVLPGQLQVDLDGNGFDPGKPQTTTQPRTGIRGQLNLIGAMFNDVFDYPKGSMLKDLFLYYSIHTTWNFVPSIRAKGGAQHHVELGVDFGAKYYVSKGIFAELGVITHPFAMSYIELLNIPIEPIVFPGEGQANELILASFHMYVGAAPFARVGFHPFKNVSVDFSIGQNYNWCYVNNIGVVAAYNGSRISSELIDIDNKDVYLNGRPISGKNFRLGGRMYGFGLTFYMP